MSVRGWLPTSLAARLVLITVGLLAVGSVLVATATILATHRSLVGRVDDRLVAASQGRYDQHLGSGLDPDGDPGDGDEPPPLAGELVVARFLGDHLVFENTSLTGAAQAQLAGLPADGGITQQKLDGLGEYRLLATTDGQQTVVYALSTGANVEKQIAGLVRDEVSFILIGVPAAAVLAWWLVRRELRPLRDVARTAHEVAALPLSSGEVSLTTRVPDRLTDERTEVGLVGAALNTVLGHVEGALEARHRSEQRVRQFVADASHELRTPLATIQGYAELPRRSPEDDPEIRAKQAEQSMIKVESEANRMAALVEDLLLLARLDAGRPLQRTEVDLTRMALETVADARLLAPDHRWVLDLPPDPVTTEGDEQRLHQVLTNLLANARGHTPSGTTVTVRVAGPTGPGAPVLVQVDDDGPGIPEPLQGELFERFSRGDSARTRASGGAGLGLSLVQAIVSAHGGEISVDSRPGSTTFTVALPSMAPG